MKKIFFIINPISGKKKKEFLAEEIPQYFPESDFEIEIHYTERAGHGGELAQAAVKRGFDVVVAVGGDGTINEVGAQLVHTSTALGILPLGSGNGLAHHLHIPIQPQKALAYLKNHLDKISVIDACTINDKIFFSIAGIGYDAKVAYDFNHGNQRGFAGYFHHILKDYFTYKYENYILNCDGQEMERHAFFITLANSSQWGYNVQIQPKASLSDGLLDVCIAKKPQSITLPVMVASLLANKIDHRNLIEYLQCKTLTIATHEELPLYWHVDGDAMEPTTHIEIKLLEQALRIVGSEKKY